MAVAPLTLTCDRIIRHKNIDIRISWGYAAWYAPYLFLNVAQTTTSEICSARHRFSLLLNKLSLCLANTCRLRLSIFGRMQVIVSLEIHRTMSLREISVIRQSNESLIIASSLVAPFIIRLILFTSCTYRIIRKYIPCCTHYTLLLLLIRSHSWSL